MLLLPLLLLPLPACGHGAAVRAPTSKERRLVVATVRGTWSYESRPDAAGYSPQWRTEHLERPSLRPKVTHVLVSRRDPRYASALVELRDARGRRRGLPTVLVLKKSSAYGRRQWGFPIAGPALTFKNDCGRTTLRALRDLMCPDPWAVLGAPHPRVRLQTHFTQRIASPDVQLINWKNVTLPGGVCGSSRPIRPWHRSGSGAEAFVHPDVDSLWWNPVWVYSWEKPVYGDGRDEAALSVICANGGGTADGQLAFSVVVFKAVGRALRVVGIVTPQQPLTTASGHVPILTTVKFERRHVIAAETWYGPYDGTCCGSGRAQTTWAYRGGRLHPLRTTVVRKPWLSPLQVEAMTGPPARDLYGAQGGQPTTRVALTPRRFFQVDVSNISLGHVTKRHVRVTLKILGAGPPVVRTQTTGPIRPWHATQTLRFGNLPRLAAGEAIVEIDLHDRGAWPLRYGVVFTRR
jgi:hypothetical protein